VKWTTSGFINTRAARRLLVVRHKMPTDAATNKSATKKSLRLRLAADRSRARLRTLQPRPTNGIVLAITVMNSTLVSSGRLAM
jgi:hypothetical protein